MEETLSLMDLGFCDVLCDVTPSCHPLQAPPTQPHRCQQALRKFLANSFPPCNLHSFHLIGSQSAQQIDTVEVCGSSLHWPTSQNVTLPSLMCFDGEHASPLNPKALGPKT